MALCSSIERLERLDRLERLETQPEEEAVSDTGGEGEHSAGHGVSICGERRKIF